MIATAVLPVGRVVARPLGPVCKMVIGDGRRARCASVDAVGGGGRIGVFGPFARDSGRIGILKAYPRATVSPDCRGGADLPVVAILGDNMLTFSQERRLAGLDC